MAVAWYLLKTINAYPFLMCLIHPGSLYTKIFHFLHHVLRMISGPMGLRLAAWVAPPEDMFNLNFDGLVSIQSSGWSRRYNLRSSMAFDPCLIGKNWQCRPFGSGTTSPCSMVSHLHCQKKIRSYCRRQRLDHPSRCASGFSCPPTFPGE